MASTASASDQAMDRNPALHPQGDSTPMPCHGEQVFDPKSVGVAQENRQSGQKEHEASLRYQNPVNLGSDTSMLRQPETKPISHDQLVVEVKGIYAGLVMVEAKCIEVDEGQKVWAQIKDYASRNPVTPDQWRSLIALHKQLLHEHHDFFLANQHPASNNLSRLAAKYIMPARIWRHGFHGFLEVLRYRLPGLLEHKLAFIYTAYNMMALLFETVPSFEDTWIECLGNLGRYRMVIEDDEPKNREIWSNVARYWYCKGSSRHQIAMDRSRRVKTIVARLATANISAILEERQQELHSKYVAVTERINSLESRFSSVSRRIRFGRKSYTSRIKDQADAPMVQYGQVLRTQEKPAGRAEETSSIISTAPIYARHISPDSFPPDESWKLERTEKTSSITSTTPIYARHISSDSFPSDESWKLERAEETSSITSTTPTYARHISSDSLPPDESWKLERHGYKTENGGALQSFSRSSFLRLPLLNGMRRILVGASLLRVTIAMPPSPAALETSTISYENFYVGLLYIFSAGLFIGVAQYVSKAQGPITTHGIAMGVESLGWWLIANDDATSKGLRFIVLLLWTISTWQYSNAASAKLQLPRWATLGSIVLAIGFDICVVRTMTPSNVAVSQNDILTLSLPSVSLALGVTVIIFPVIQERLRRPDRPPPHSTGGDPSINSLAAD